MPVLATLINKSGDKRVVTSGSAEADNLFSQGFKLMGSDGKPVEPFDQPAPTSPSPTPEQPTPTPDPAYSREYASNFDLQDVVNSSDAIVQDERNTTSEVLRLFNNLQQGSDASVREASDRFTNVLEERLKQLEKRREEEVSFINQQFNQTRDKTLQDQKAEFGTNVVGLQRIGGFLGGSASHIGRLNNLSQEHRADLASLEAQRARAIQQAKAAVDEKEFQTASLLAQEAKSIEQTIFDRRNTFFNQALSALQEQRLETSSLFNIISNIPEGQTIDLNGQQFTGIAKTEVEPFFTGSNIVQLMKELPVGETQSIVDPNTGVEFTVTGLRSDDPNVKTVQSVDDAGNVTITSYELTAGGGARIINQASAGKIGKTKTAAPSVTLIMNEAQQNALAVASDFLEESRGSDGFYNTEVFSEQRSRFIQETGKPDLFDQTFKQGLNPDDESAQRFLSKSEIELFSDSGGFSEQDRQTLRDLDFTEEEIEEAALIGLPLSELMGF